MSIQRVLPSSWLDEIGTKYGMPRFKKEDYRSYRRRVLDHIRHLPEPTEKSYLRTINRTVGLEPKHLLEIKPKLIWDEVLEEYKTLVPDPYIEIDSGFLRVFSGGGMGEELDDTEPVIELDIVNRSGAYFLKDVFDALDTVDFLEVKPLVNLDDWKYKKSSHLAYGNTLGVRQSHGLIGSRINLLQNNHIIDIRFENDYNFANEIVAQDETGLSNDGDYHIDYVDGIVFSKLPAVGNCFYTYRKFPYHLTWQPVKAYPFNDKSIDHLIKDNLINEDGIEERLLLNSYGAKIVNEILAIHPLQWGK